jgi:DNA polymerase III epsilon subunit-like protein
MNCAIGDLSGAWLQAWTQRYGPFPDDYLVLDTETTGLSSDEDLIVQVGYCRVAGRSVVENGAQVLDWTSYPGVDQSWLSARLDDTRARLGARGVDGWDYPWSRERLAHGASPLVVLSDLFGRLAALCQEGGVLVAHNGYGFDVPMIEAHFRRFLFLPWQHCGGLWDTGLMEKALQLNLRPRDGETLAAFNRRARAVRGSVRWSLSDHAAPKYGLMEKHGLDTSLCHTADFDALLAMHLLEEFRDIWERSRAAAPAAIS